jgi:hypothetical protein
LLEFWDSIIRRDLLSFFLIKKRLDIKARKGLGGFTAATASAFDFGGT